MTVILGLNAFHADSAACLVVDGKLIGAVAEERLGPREKHSSAFPANAIRWLLDSNGLKLRDVTHIAIPRDTKANRFAKAAYVIQNPVTGMASTIEHFSRSKKTTSFLDLIAEICGEDPSQAKFETVFVEHHIAHIASSYYCSPFENLTSGFSYDASGDFVSGMAARCEGTSINVIDRIALPHSLGFFYTALCQFIGFDHFGEEYKVMGLAPYGEDRFDKEMETLLKLPEDGWYTLAKGYFGMHSGGSSGAVDGNNNLILDRLFKPKMKSLLGQPSQRGQITQREMDIAKSTQVRFEEAALHCLNRLHEFVPSNQIVMAGGCALNGVTNARILRETSFDHQYLQSAASDDGTCIGAAFWTWHNVLGQSERFHMQHAFWGPEYSDQDHLNALKKTKLKIHTCRDDTELVEKTAKLIAKGHVTGWYQGRSEWGPRALGNRSILANPCIPNMKQLINDKIKRRESFRPFAPSVLKEDVSSYFEQNIYSPFMMHVAKIKAEWRKKLPSVTHVDGTGRLQSVCPDSNKLYYNLISAVKKQTGVGIVLNTSFNENEPIVDHPDQAVSCFLRTDMDSLVIGRHIVSKTDQ